MADNKNPNVSTHHTVDADFYCDDLRSPQAVEWMKGTDLSFMQQGLKRHCEMKEAMEMFDDPSKKLRDQEMFLGGYTFCMDEDDKD